MVAEFLNFTVFVAPVGVKSISSAAWLYEATPFFWSMKKLLPCGPSTVAVKVEPLFVLADPLLTQIPPVETSPALPPFPIPPLKVPSDGQSAGVRVDTRPSWPFILTLNAICAGKVDVPRFAPWIVMVALS